MMIFVSNDDRDDGAGDGRADGGRAGGGDAVDGVIRRAFAGKEWPWGM